MVTYFFKSFKSISTRKKNLAVFFLCLLGFFSIPFMMKPSSITIALTQIAPHPSLDRIRQGILDEVQAQRIGVRFVVENANGSLTAATQIAQRFISLQPKLIVSISTPSTQTVYNLAKSKNIPVIFSAVSDPIAAKLIDSFERPGDGITGVADVPPLKEQVELMQEIRPDIRRVGFIYNPGETNSMAVLPLLEEQLKEQNIVLIKAPASTIGEVPMAAKMLVGRIDAFYISNDNMVVSALDGLLKIAKEKSIPVFSSDPESVGRGALAALAADQYQIGRQTGEMIVRYLKGKDLSRILPEKTKAMQLALNLVTAKDLDIKIPEIVCVRAKTVIGLNSNNTH